VPLDASVGESWALHREDLIEGIVPTRGDTYTPIASFWVSLMTAFASGGLVPPLWE